MSTIIGHYKKSIYESDKGYIIGLFKVSEIDNDELSKYLNKTITFTGYFHDLNASDTYKLMGNLIEHEKYGEQFNVTSYERIIPEDTDSTILFLASDLFKGIGKRKATKIVNTLGEKTLNIILENKDNLYLVPTITKKDVDLIYSQLVNYQSSYKTILYLNEIGFNTKDSLIIYNHYLEETLTIINDNIYDLIDEVNELNFNKIDEISRKISIARNDPRRIKAGIVYVINEVCNLIGHTFLYKEEIYQYIQKALKINIDSDLFETSLEKLINDQKIINSGAKYYTKDMYAAEKNIALRIKNISYSEPQTRTFADDLQALEEFYQISYNDEQRQAITKAINNPMLIITGGPGTGKTTIIKAIVDLYMRLNHLSFSDLIRNVYLLAPTGRASKRMAETTNLPASTIHRFLKWDKETNKFNVNELNKINCQMVIVDEASMIDTYLFDSLLKGLPNNTKIILVGDYDQLPSVGPGQVLKDLIESSYIETIKLNTLYRQGEGSDIITLAHNINEGIMDNDVLVNAQDITFMECAPSQVKEAILNLCKHMPDLNNFQVMAPIYKGINGIDELNKSLQTLYNKRDATKKEITIGDVIYREGDKVLQLTNMPDENVFNGDVGFISSINISPRKEMLINYDDNIVRYTPSNFHKFKHGYAISIHKSQGNEFDYAIIPFVKNYYNMLYRKLIYTAVTRCKKKLYLVGEKEAIIMSIKNNNSDIRRTSLKEMLDAYFS